MSIAHPLQIAELESRRLAHDCPVYAPGQAEAEKPGAALKATISGQRATACGAEWMRHRAALKAQGLEPLSLDHQETT